MPISNERRHQICAKLNGPGGPDQVTWMSDEDRFDMIEDRLDEIGDVLSDCRKMLRKLLSPKG